MGKANNVCMSFCLTICQNRTSITCAADKLLDYILYIHCWLSLFQVNSTDSHNLDRQINNLSNDLLIYRNLYSSLNLQKEHTVFVYKQIFYAIYKNYGMQEKY